MIRYVQLNKARNLEIDMFPQYSRKKDIWFYIKNFGLFSKS